LKVIREYSKDINSFKAFWDTFTFRLLAFPEKYTPAISSIPGIRITPVYQGPVEKVRYTAEGGSLFKWDPSHGNISQGGKAVELSYNIPAYWSPVTESGLKPLEEGSVVTVELLDKSGVVIAEKKLTVQFDGSLYSVKPASGIIVGIKSKPEPEGPVDMDEAVSLAIKSKYYPDFKKQQEEQAGADLKRIGKDSEVNGDHVEKNLV